MPNFVFAYHGGKMPETPEEGAKVKADWQNWFGTIGESIVDPGNPVGMSKTVTAGGVTDDGGANPVSGYSIVSASDMNAAIALAKGCPMVKDGSGNVEVAEVHQM